MNAYAGCKFSSKGIDCAGTTVKQNLTQVLTQPSSPPKARSQACTNLQNAEFDLNLTWLLFDWGEVHIKSLYDKLKLICHWLKKLGKKLRIAFNLTGFVCLGRNVPMGIFQWEFSFCHFISFSFCHFTSFQGPKVSVWGHGIQANFKDDFIVWVQLVSVVI